jgi:serine phosphatase RsbU (regulator of sigma subunit)
MICFACLSFSDFQQAFVQTVPTVLIWIHISFASIILTVLFGLLTSYQRAFAHIPKQMFIFIGFAVLLLGWYFVSPNRQINIFFYIYLILSGVELIRVNIANLFKKDKWEWVIGLGFLIMVIIVAYQLLISTAVVEPMGNQTLVYVYGILIVSITTSINLARDFSKVQEKVFVQEREAKDREIQRRVLEADNIRKTQELEEARKLQLSMLPETIPQLPHLDIAVYMKTATEVGGDYYDFKLEQDGTLTVVIGDATGHGTKAGIMVALVKNIFNAMGHTFFIPDFFKHATKLIKQMNLGHLYMALLLMKIRKNHVIFSSAGMPPVLIYRSENKKIEEKVIKGLPLGGIESFNYGQAEFNLQPGDIILLMSDGFAELFNAQNDTIGFSRVKDIFLQANQKNPDKIIQQFVEFGEKWRGKRQQNDDVTFLIIKMKSVV